MGITTLKILLPAHIKYTKKGIPNSIPFFTVVI